MANIRENFYSLDEYDSDIPFLRMIEDVTRPGMSMLDLGAGPGSRFHYGFKTMIEPDGEIVGADFDSRVLDNPLLHRGVVLEGPELPFDPASFDIVFCRYVIEHIQNPHQFVQEVSRVLRPGGHFLFLAPNKWHYYSVISRLTPHSFHVWYNNLRKRDAEDTFPTVYRMNTRRTIRKMMCAEGLIEKACVMRECSPNYLTMAKPLFLVGVAFERLVNRFSLLAGLRIHILGHFCKPA